MIYMKYKIDVDISELIYKKALELYGVESFDEVISILLHDLNDDLNTEADFDLKWNIKKIDMIKPCNFCDNAGTIIRRVKNPKKCEDCIIFDEWMKRNVD